MIEDIARPENTDQVKRATQRKTYRPREAPTPPFAEPRTGPDPLMEMWVKARDVIFEHGNRGQDIFFERLMSPDGLGWLNSLPPAEQAFVLELGALAASMMAREIHLGFATGNRDLCSEAQVRAILGHRR